MSSLSRSEYRREERRVTESPFKETKWDRHLDTLLTDLNDSVGSGGGGQQRSVVPASLPQGQITELHGVPGSGDFHERREYTSPDQRTRVVQERYEHTNRGDNSTVPSRICVSNQYETNIETNRWPGSRHPSHHPVGSRPAHDYLPSARSDARRSEPLSGRGYGPARHAAGPEPVDDLRSEPDYARGYDPEPLSRSRAGSMRSDIGYGGRSYDPEPQPFSRRYGSARASGHGRRSPPYAEVYRAGAELAGYGYSRPYEPPTQRHASPPAGGKFARALSPVQTSAAQYRPPDANQHRPQTTNYGHYGAANRAVTKQVYKSYASDQAPPPAQAGLQPPQQAGDGSRFKQNILELDSLLDDLDHARKKPESNGVDPGLVTYDGPTGTSTPYRQTNVQKTVTTNRYTSSGAPEPPPTQLTPGDQLTALGLTGPRHSPSPNPLDRLDTSLIPELADPPQPGTTRVTKYEYRSSNRRDVSPQPVPLQQLQPVQQPPSSSTTLPPPEKTKTYIDRREYTSATNTLDRPQQPPVTDVSTDKTVVYNVYNSGEPTLPGVPAPPVPPGQPGSNTTINYHIYNYGTLGPDGQPVGLPPGVMPPGGSAPPSETGAPPRSGTLPRQPEVHTHTTTTLHERYRDKSPPHQPPPQHRSPAPGPDTTVSSSYVYEKHARGPTPQRQPPPPQQQPQPRQPTQPGGPTTSYTTNTITKHYTIGPDGTEIPVRPGSPGDQQYPKFPVDDYQPPGGHHTRTTTTTIERTHTHGSPFPARSTSPSPRRPHRDDGPRVPFPGSPRIPVDDIDTPRRVDELMAQIPDTPQDGTYPHGPRRRELGNGRHPGTTHFTVHETEPLIEGQTKVTLDAKSGAVVPHTPTKPVSGMPVYYPPGSTDFKPKPESELMFQSYESSSRGGGGKYSSKSKSGWKASGKSSSKSGSRESHAEGGAVIPICLPLCCGAACSVM